MAIALSVSTIITKSSIFFGEEKSLDFFSKFVISNKFEISSNKY